MDKGKEKYMRIGFIALYVLVIISLIIPKVVQGIKKKRNKIFRGKLVKLEGKQLVTDFDRNGKYDPYFIKGIEYTPFPIGRHPRDRGVIDSKGRKHVNIYQEDDILKRDFELLKKMNCNTIRIKCGNVCRYNKKGFNHKLTRKVLNYAKKYGMNVIVGYAINIPHSYCKRKKRIFRNPDFRDERVREREIKLFSRFVRKLKVYNNILIWAIGDSDNEHINIKDKEQMEAWYSFMDEMAKAAHEAEGLFARPVAVVNGEIDTIGSLFYGSTDLEMKNIDIWGVKAFRGNSFGTLFSEYEFKTEKPLWIADFGVDAFSAYYPHTPEQGVEDQSTQAEWIGLLWDEIVFNRAFTIGATIREYSDQWWRPDPGRDGGIYNETHDGFGLGPQDMDCNGSVDWIPPAPDSCFNEEWWGIVSMEKGDGEDAIDVIIPRAAYYTLKEKFQVDLFNNNEQKNESNKETTANNK